MVRSQIKLQIQASFENPKDWWHWAHIPCGRRKPFYSLYYHSLFLYWSFIIAFAWLLSSVREIFICIMSLSKMQKEKWAGAKGILVSRELWENIYLSRCEEYSNTLTYEHLAKATHVCYLTGPITTWACELWSVVNQLQNSERVWRIWQEDFSTHRWNAAHWPMPLQGGNINSTRNRFPTHFQWWRLS